MSLTPEQREAAWLALRGVYGRSSMDADRALHALTDAGFLLLREDDVIERFGSNNAGERSRRLVTRWEPITNEVVGPWTTQETP